MQRTVERRQVPAKGHY